MRRRRPDPERIAWERTQQLFTRKVCGMEIPADDPVPLAIDVRSVVAVVDPPEDQLDRAAHARAFERLAVAFDEAWAEATLPLLRRSG